MRYAVIDENGKRYSDFQTACLDWGLDRPGGCQYNLLTKNGKVRVKGHLFTLDNGTVPEPKPTKRVAEDPLMKKLRKRFTDSELEQIAKGEGIETKRIPYTEIHLTGEHHRMLVMSDTHIGSIYSPEEWHTIVSEYANNNDIDCILHCGDLVEGLKIGRAGTQIYELSELGFMKQKAKAIELLSMYKKPVYIISGNHDMYFQEFAGANIVEEVAKALPNVEYIGHDQATIEVDGCSIMLWHGGDGNSYALSYRLQKIIESFTGGSKPNILLAGHVHKFVYLFERNIHALSVPCLQQQTSFMRGKRLAAHTGFCVIDFDTFEGNVVNFSVELFPFYA